MPAPLAFSGGSFEGFEDEAAPRKEQLDARREIPLFASRPIRRKRMGKKRSACFGRNDGGRGRGGRRGTGRRSRTGNGDEERGRVAETSKSAPLKS